MEIALFLAGALAMAAGEAILHRFGPEEVWRGILGKMAARRGWAWLSGAVTASEALKREQRALQERDMLGSGLQRVKEWTYSDRISFGLGPWAGSGDRYLRVDTVGDEDDRLMPVAIISSRQGRWKQIPLELADVETVAEALGSGEMPLGWLLARATDEQLQGLPGAQKTALIHALLMDDDIPSVVEGLVDRHLKAKAAQAVTP